METPKIVQDYCSSFDFCRNCVFECRAPIDYSEFMVWHKEMCKKVLEHVEVLKLENFPTSIAFENFCNKNKTRMVHIFMEQNKNKDDDYWSSIMIDGHTIDCHWYKDEENKSTLVFYPFNGDITVYAISYKLFIRGIQ